MSQVSDVIEASVPYDVAKVVDRAGDMWTRVDEDAWQLDDGSVGETATMLTFGPLTVTAVREPERKVERAGWPEDEVVHYRIPGDASPLTLCGLDVWADDTSVTERAGSSNCPACREAADEDKPEPELPPDVDELSLLALVRLHGEERRQEGYTLANPADGMDVVYRHGEAAQALFERIAALVPQQPGDDLAAWLEYRGLPPGTSLRELIEQERATERLAAGFDFLREHAAQQPDPSVLSLPQVPPGTVALIGGRTGRRYERYSDSWRGPMATLPLGDLLQVEGSVSVVMREPRTWPKLDGAPVDVKAFHGDSGRLYTRSTIGAEANVRPLYYPAVAQFERHKAAAARPMSHWREVDGPLTEVLP